MSAFFVCLGLVGFSLRYVFFYFSDDPPPLADKDNDENDETTPLLGHVAGGDVAEEDSLDVVDDTLEEDSFAGPESWDMA